MGEKYKILIIEDDLSVYNSVAYFLKGRHIFADHAPDNSIAKMRLSNNFYDLVVLDLNLPDAYGIDVCKYIRQKYVGLPILILSASSGEMNRIIGLEAGANDYLEKPFNILELYARLKNLLSFISQKIVTKRRKIIFLEFVFDQENMTLVHTDKKVELTKVETKILDLLLSRHGQIVSKYDIATLIGISNQETSRSLSVLMARLRNKLGDRRATIIKTIRSYGFIFVTPIFESKEDIKTLKAELF